MSDFSEMKLVILDGKIEVLTGLHIGAGKDDIQIGGIDAPVIRRPGTNEPYIPGSSLKGKLRSLSEWSIPEVLSRMMRREKGKGDPCNCGEPDCPVCVVYGSSAKNNVDRGPTRLIVRDAVVEGGYFYEDKTENSINRIEGKAANPRHIERVAPGAKFSFSMSFKVLKESDRKYFKEVVLKSMELLEQDYLGGNGSRGYGKIKFFDLKYSDIKDKTFETLSDLINSL